MTIETKEILMSEELKRKVEMICRFAYVDYTITNGNIKSIKNTNIAFVKPHIIKIKNTEFLIFDNCDDIFINNYKEKIKFKDLDKQLDRIKNAYIKSVLKLENFEKEIKHIEFQKNDLNVKMKE